MKPCRGSSAFIGERAHLNQDDIKHGSWHPARREGCYHPGQRYTILDLYFGAKLDNWYKGMVMKDSSNHTLIFDGKRWRDRSGNAHDLKNFRTYTRDEE